MRHPWRPWRLLRRKRIIGSVEIHTAGFLRKSANLTDAQAAGLQPYLASMAVRSEQRGRGVGRQLVDAAVAELAGGPDRRLLLQVERDNAPAVRLYRSAGFADSAVQKLISILFSISSQRGAHFFDTPWRG